MTEELANAILDAKDAVEGLAISDKEYRDAVYAEAGVKNKSEFLERLIADIYSAYEDADLEDGE